MKNIVLLGFMGTGKTSVGNRLAEELGWKSIDTDLLIVERMGISIPDIFKNYGEKRFRLEEEIVIRKVASEKFQVIATGGGAVLNSINIKYLKEDSFLICLKARPEIICKRVKKNNNRPLLNTENCLDKIIEMLIKREECYSCADMYIDTSDLSVNAIVENILREIRKWGVSDARNEKG